MMYLLLRLHATPERSAVRWVHAAAAMARSGAIYGVGRHSERTGESK
jgi:hypothetical protein